MNTKASLLGLLTATLLSSTAFAADVYSGKDSMKDGGVFASKTLDWTGMYVGIHGGYAWGDMDVDLSHSSGAIHYNDKFADPHQTLDGGEGAIAGIQIGFNRQRGNIVFGLEADASWTNIDGSGEYSTAYKGDPATWNIDQELVALGTLRARIGFTTGPLLVYATGGLALGAIETEQATNWYTGVDRAGGRTDGTNYHLGWTAGGGAEYALGQGWSLKGEYLYVDLGEQDYALKGTVSPTSSTPYVETMSAEQEFHIFRAGLNYRF
jgi:outer membrane immunogenic protein